MSNPPTSRVRRLALALCGLAVLACGSRSTGPTRGPVEAPVLPKASPEALRDFDAGMRAIRLGGPEAYERARTRLSAAAERDPKLWEAWHNLGALHYLEGDDEAAIAAFSKALKINPAHTPSLLARAEAYRRAQRFSEARKDYEAAISRDDTDASIHIRYAASLREEGRLDDAVDAAREALRQTSSPDLLVELGLIYLAQGRDELAELVFNKALSEKEQLPAAWNALALVAMARGDDQLAFARFDRATSLDPNFRDARFNKANVLLSAGDHRSAQAELEKVVGQDPEDFGARVALGVAQRGGGDLQQARRTWEKVVKDAPSRSRPRADALFNLAILEMDFGERDEKRARAALDRYLQNAPRNHPNRPQAVERMKELGQ